MNRANKKLAETVTDLISFRKSEIKASLISIMTEIRETENTGKGTMDKLSEHFKLEPDPKLTIELCHAKKEFCAFIRNTLKKLFLFYFIYDLLKDNLTFQYYNIKDNAKSEELQCKKDIALEDVECILNALKPSIKFYRDFYYTIWKGKVPEVSDTNCKYFTFYLDIGKLIEDYSKDHLTQWKDTCKRVRLLSDTGIYKRIENAVKELFNQKPKEFSEIFQNYSNDNKNSANPNSWAKQQLKALDIELDDSESDLYQFSGYQRTMLDIFTRTEMLCGTLISKLEKVQKVYVSPKDQSKFKNQVVNMKKVRDRYKQILDAVNETSCNTTIQNRKQKSTSGRVRVSVSTRLNLVRIFSRNSDKNCRFNEFINYSTIAVPSYCTAKQAMEQVAKKFDIPDYSSFRFRLIKATYQLKKQKTSKKSGRSKKSTKLPKIDDHSENFRILTNIDENDDFEIVSQITINLSEDLLDNGVFIERVDNGYQRLELVTKRFLDQSLAELKKRRKFRLSQKPKVAKKPKFPVKNDFNDAKNSTNLYVPNLTKGTKVPAISDIALKFERKLSSEKPKIMRRGTSGDLLYIQERSAPFEKRQDQMVAKLTAHFEGQKGKKL